MRWQFAAASKKNTERFERSGGREGKQYDIPVTDRYSGGRQRASHRHISSRHRSDKSNQLLGPKAKTNPVHPRRASTSNALGEELKKLDEAGYCQCRFPHRVRTTRPISAQRTTMQSTAAFTILGLTAP